jgi:hypothetical protein
MAAREEYRDRCLYARSRRWDSSGLVGLRFARIRTPLPERLREFGATHAHLPLRDQAVDVVWSATCQGGPTSCYCAYTRGPKHRRTLGTRNVCLHGRIVTACDRPHSLASSLHHKTNPIYGCLASRLARAARPCCTSLLLLRTHARLLAWTRDREVCTPPSSLTRPVRCY